MTRSSYKLPYTARSLKNKENLDQTLLSNFESKTNNSASILTNSSFKEKSLKTSPLTTYHRSSTILPEMIGLSVKIHSGQKFVKLNVLEHTVGYKFGEFAPSKKRALYKKKKKG